MLSLDDYFSVQVFFIVLRETLELAIIISVLLAFVGKSFGTKSGKLSKEALRTAQTLHGLRLQIWIGGLLGFLVCLVVGGVILSVFYTLGSDLWASTEHYWEGAFSIAASIIISIMGVKMLRVNHMQRKWKYKLGNIMLNMDYMGSETVKSSWSERYAMFILPFVTTLREGLEAIVFVGGIGINEDTSVVAIVNSAVSAMAIGSLVGFVLYRSGNTLSLQLFLIISSCFLYLVAAGLFSKGVWNFELQRFIDLCGGMDVSETGHGPGSYDISKSVWHVNCCNGEMAEDGVGWMLFTAIFGWTNSATIGLVISYNVYWLVVITMFGCLTFEEAHGRLPVIPLLWQRKRIQKRAYLEVPAQPASHDRPSVDSINSRTPLN